MTDQHQPGSNPDDEGPDLEKLLGQLFSGQAGGEMPEALKDMGLGQMDPAMMGMIQAQLRAMMSGPDDGSFDPQLATDAARQALRESGDPAIGDDTVRDVDQAVQVASLWLDQATDLDRPSGQAQAWTRNRWVEKSMPTWLEVTDPIARGVGGAMHDAMKQQVQDLPEDAEIPGMPPGMDPRAMLGQMEPMMRRMSGAMFGMQVGQAVGALAGEIVSGTDVGLPLVKGGHIVLLPGNVAAFAEGLELPPGETHLYLATREAARVRLFSQVPWLGPQLVTAVQTYAADISIDTDAIEAAVRDVDTSDPAAMQQALGPQMFTPEPSEAQRAALKRLETRLALVEGWVDVVTDRATRDHLPHAEALGEAVRRRRAAGGPAEKVFSSLVGLELRPRRLRDAANLFAALESKGGADLRDSIWDNPDALPTADDLDDPLGYAERAAGGEGNTDDLDAELAKLLADESGSDEGGDQDGTTPQG